MKKLILYIPLIILIVMLLLTLENVYTLFGIDMADSGNLGIINTFVYFPIMFLIYGGICGKYGKKSIYPILITFLTFMVIVITYYSQFIQFPLCMISVPLFLGSFILTYNSTKWK